MKHRPFPLTFKHELTVQKMCNATPGLQESPFLTNCSLDFYLNSKKGFGLKYKYNKVGSFLIRKNPGTILVQLYWYNFTTMPCTLDCYNFILFLKARHYMLKQRQQTRHKAKVHSTCLSYSQHWPHYRHNTLLTNMWKGERKYVKCFIYCWDNHDYFLVKFNGLTK